MAISNNRLLGFTGEEVSFRWKDYRHESKQKVIRLPAAEFVRRFLLHVLPSGFQRIRHYGLLANRSRAANLQRCREVLGVSASEPVQRDAPEDYRDRYQRLTGVALRDCPSCGR